ncbi:hypothetical protein Nos7524_4334 [Nostoc sp. PCC 7524]|nr:hypothetical protein Nos7524_4334 [Nostoc sp. PCC 7524]
MSQCSLSLELLLNLRELVLETKVSNGELLTTHYSPFSTPYLCLRVDGANFKINLWLFYCGKPVSTK